MDDDEREKWLNRRLELLMIIPTVLMVLSAVFMDVNSDDWSAILLILFGFPACWAVFVIIPFMWSTQSRNLYIATMLYFLFLILVYVVIHPLLVFSGLEFWISLLVIIGLLLAAVQPVLLRVANNYQKNSEERRSLEQKRRESDYIDSG